MSDCTHAVGMYLLSRSYSNLLLRCNEAVTQEGSKTTEYSV